MPRGPQWRDPDTGRALSLEQFAKKADQVYRDLQRALGRRQKAGAALIDARTTRQERARSKSLQAALRDVERHRRRQEKIDAQLGPPERPVIPPATEWELSVRYTSGRRGSMHLAIRFRRADSAAFGYEEVRPIARQWRRDGSIAPGYDITGVDWSTKKKTYSYGQEALTAAQPIVASTPIGQMRIGRAK